MQKITKKIPSPNSIKKAYAIQPSLKSAKKAFDTAIKSNFKSKKRFVVVVGPCSADNFEPMSQYLTELKQISDQISDKILVVARIFTAKPRTDGQGFLGLAFHDMEDQPVHFERGIIACRKLMQNCLKIGLPIADELLFPEISKYFDDLVSYHFVGARSSLDPLHRAVASGLNVVVGAKNSIDGDLAAVAKTVFAIQTPKQYLANSKQIETKGNKYAHIVLRGFHDGTSFQKNCNAECTKKAVQLLKELNVKNPFIMVDCSHANSGKIPQNQIQNALQVVGDKNTHGIILESYLHSGIAKNSYGISKTDDCLDLESTKNLLIDIYNKLKQK